MILTGPEIEMQVKEGRIEISPFDYDQLNPNSYDFCLGKEILTYSRYLLDPREEQPTTSIEIPAEGMVLMPGRLYLGHTAEKMGSDHYVPIIRAKSSIARLGLFIHVTADLIDLGSHNQWTLQLNPIQPVKIYAGMKIGQVTFWVVRGEPKLYSGKYQGTTGPCGYRLPKEENAL